jgi:hypothetical protein
MSQNTSTAVMARRVEPPDSLDYFPTPPWATRALCEIVLRDFDLGSVWEPACGEGHMAEVLREYAYRVFASDVFDYGCGQDAVGSFVGVGPDIAQPPHPMTWIITNPPFNLAGEFLARARIEARGVAMLLRTAWLEGGERYNTIFSKHPPHVVALFAERVPMVKGRWDPKASTATSYAWCVWKPGSFAPGTHLQWIPPGQRQRLSKPDDVARFAKP